MLEPHSSSTVTKLPPGALREVTLPRPLPWLAAVSGVFVVAQLALVVPGTGLGWDETVYTSQVSGSIPAAFFSAPRARGISYLAAPVAMFSDSTLTLRVWMALLSGVGLFLALWVWRTLLPVRVLAVAGGLFAGLWISLYYGPQVMPNLWSAYGALAAVGCFLRVIRDSGDRKAAVGLGVAMAVVGLMRPPDALWLAIPLVGAMLVVRGWRRPLILAALAAGLLLGCGSWVLEAYTSYGGLSARLDRASEIQGGMGWHIAVDDQVRALDGRALCRPCDVPWRHKAFTLWWFALPLVALAGTAVAYARRRRAVVVLPPLVAAFLAVQYLFLIDYGAPRFLLPAYALLALPVAECVCWLVADLKGWRQPLSTVLVSVALLGHLGLQFAVLSNTVNSNRKMRREYDAVAARLHDLGVRPPCTISGDHAVPIAFYAGCASRQIAGHDASTTAPELLAAARDQPLAVLVPPKVRPPAYARHWRSVPLPSSPALRGFRVLLAPNPFASSP